MKQRVRLIGVATLLLGMLLVLAGPLCEVEMAVIRIYQSVASPTVSHFANCRFQPTCSSYAMVALEEGGFWNGNLRIALRLLHCSPVGAVLL